jgi:hypothetical protein
MARIGCPIRRLPARRSLALARFIPEVVGRKIIGETCTGKTEFIGFSVHNTPTIGSDCAGA